MITARSTPNIALIKYWGNRHDEFRLCANENLAMTLDGPHVDVSIELAETLSVTSANKEMTEKDTVRFQKTLNLIEVYLATIAPTEVSNLTITIDSQIPPSIGLASSAAVFSALAKAVSGLVDADLTDEQISVMARLGSGSAARSIFGGYGAVRNEENLFIDGSKGWQVADEHHWNLHDIIIVPSTEEKKVGSSEGHPKAWTSPDFAKRVEDINNHRQQECIDALLAKDFEKLQAVVEEDCMEMHHCMQTQDPPLNYLSDETYRILDEVKSMRKADHLPVLYTMDAGPTVHLFCTDEAKERITEYAHAQESCKVFEASVGQGAYLV
ncbi:MAG: diphosphomevalonate decarboxylase [Candidatus Peribacter sp.]|jgi:diphosphomevalonate decarboxylase|nr:diphosphomevalonate decarboxylase [Candidatus Peribacter sp.]MBT4392668.1 diphosphomevalonate decarboxylase [Candidatus Peribacter sp.]MBT4600715.1 diphosphomevalonate decarboxylase [Candidatus Peribacter sp.]MBT5148616.1 diphosphomevalonate decarboxylase [Candidatus Peribacter sp.]MBT5637788.1 diphosphomevalonate decarboxylase [Candidatus Peribacter sp.]